MDLNEKGKERFHKYLYYKIDFDEFVQQTISIQIYSDNNFILKYTILDFNIDDTNDALCYSSYLTWVRENKIDKIV